MCGACSQYMEYIAFGQLKAVCAFHVYTAQAPGCSSGALSKVGPAFVHFPGLSHSGSQVLHKGTGVVGHAFFPFAGPSNSGNQVLGKHTVPGGLWVLITSLVPVTRFHLRCAMCLLWGADHRL